MIVTGTYEFIIGQKVQKCPGGLMKLPPGVSYEINSTSETVGIMQFLILDDFKDDEEERG